jgi:hypothetical protein
VNITPPVPPATVSTSPLVFNGTASNSFSVFFSTNRGQANLTTGPTSTWTASVPLEPGLNVITVTAVSNDTLSQGSRLIEVTLEQAEPVIGTNPTSVAFGNQAVGTLSGIRIVTVRNDGPGRPDHRTHLRRGGNASQFVKTNPKDFCSGHTVAQGGRAPWA